MSHSHTILIGFGQKKPSKRKLKLEDAGKGQKDIRGFFGNRAGSSSPASHAGGAGGSGNVFGFGGTSFGLPGPIGGVATKGKSGTVVVRPRSGVQDNSSGGRQIVDSTETPTPSTSASGGSGQRLSGSAGEISGGVDARQMVRNVWAGKYGGGEKDKVRKGDDNNTAVCPVCSAKIESALINQHLDDCLTKQSLMEDEGESSDVSVICKKCQREVNVGEWQFHDSVCS